MNKRYLIFALVLIALLTFVFAQMNSSSPLASEIKNEFTGGCVDENGNYQPDYAYDSFFDISYQGDYVNPEYLSGLAVSAEQGSNALDQLINSEGLERYNSLPQSNFKGYIQKIKTAINTAGLVSERARETVKNTADKTSRILESENFNINQASSDVTSIINQVSEQYTQVRNSEIAANYVLAQLSNPSSAKNNVLTAADNLATASTLLESAKSFSQIPEKNSLVLAYAQLTESAALIQLASIRYALVYFMLLNDIKENPKHYERYMYEQGPPCSETTEMPCTGCTSPDFWASIGCPVIEQDTANQISAAAVAEPITEFPSFDTTRLKEALEFNPVKAEPSFVAVLDSNIRKLETKRDIFLSDRGITTINNAMYIDDIRVNIGTNGIIDYYTGDPIRELDLDDIHTYKEMKFLLQDLYPSIRRVAVIESNKGPAEQHINAYDKMIKTNLDFIDLLDKHEREDIWAARISEEMKEKRLAYANFKTTEAKVNAIESAISNNRLNHAVLARQDIAFEINTVIKERTPKNTVEILRLLTNDDLLVEYYSALEHTLEES